MDLTKSWLDFGGLDLIFKVTGGLSMLENDLSALYLLKIWMDFDQTCTCLDMNNNWLDFGNLDPIFKVTWGLSMWENGLSESYLLKE